MKKLERLTPPGTDVARELKVYAIGALLLIVIYSFGFLFEYSSEYRALFVWLYGRRVLSPEARIRPLIYILQHKFLGFWGFASLCVGETVMHYRTCYADSKSIYVMRRVKSARELHVRSAALPALALAAGIVLALVLIGIYTLLYFTVTPRQCIDSTAVGILRAFF